MLEAIFYGIFISFFIIKNKYKNFVEMHSKALKQLKKINDNYSLKSIKNIDMEYSYDNEKVYGDISCKDYLIYELVNHQKQVSVSLKDSLNNKNLYEQYMREVNNTLIYNQYDTLVKYKNINRLNRLEKEIIEKNLKYPPTEFSINVHLRLTNINGFYIMSKHATFYSKDIKDIMTKLNQKRGSFYLNNDIWQSICRVERGKVTNKMRFAIYERDHYRCRECGRMTNDLEIDHIIPIAKGGKSTFDNLQTLCHSCNYKKGSTM